ncbi:MAG: excalibur calcium-binding domain-containing protein [Acinetobacter baumannii]|nr:excalibur calcium-binding domain-containing protein [Acinetobacter baumannii]
MPKKLILFIFLSVTFLLSACINDAPSLKNVASKTVENDKHAGINVEEARHLYNEQVRQRTLDNPFSDEPSVVQTLPKSRSSNSGDRIIKQSSATSQGSFKCGSVPRYCKEMVSCAQAKAALKCGNSRLDRDGDGIPCENVCR